MSRMLAFVADRALTPAEAWGGELLDEFAALARLHSDGWGSAWTDPVSGVSGTSGVDPFLPARLDGAAASTARTVYLRFASKGSPPRLENTQPFVREGLAFQHNGLLAPRELALGLLSPEEAAGLVGDTDSEVYFAIVRRHLGAAGAAGEARLKALADAVGEVRAVYPASCLNAFVLDGAGLFVVHAAGSAPTPLAAFAGRGFVPEALPPGHDDGYNTLRTVRSASGGWIVATSGVDQSGWAKLPRESVSRIDATGIRSTSL